MHAAVFGSVARGEARADSDVDIVVDLEPHKPSGTYEYVRLQKDISTPLNRRADVVERAAMKKHIRETVLADAVEIF